MCGSSVTHDPYTTNQFIKCEHKPQDDAGVNLTEEQIIEYNDMKALAGIKDIIQKLECEFPDHNVTDQP